MPALAPLKEVVDIIKEAGGEELKLCYQCGLCTGVCPWNTVRSFLVRRIMHQAQLGGLLEHTSMFYSLHRFSFLNLANTSQPTLTRLNQLPKMRTKIPDDLF